MSSTYYEYLQEKNCLYHWNRAEKQANALKKGYEEVSSLRIEKYFEWIIEQLLNSAFVWYGMGIYAAPKLLSTDPDDNLGDKHPNHVSRVLFRTRL